MASESAPKTILICDDEVHVRQVMTYKLGAAGYLTQTASDGQEGYDMARELKPDLILSDFKMPRCDGLQMVRKLAEDPVTRGIPIIMVTSRDFDVSPQDIEGTGVKHVLNKPFSPAQVVKLVTGLLPP